MRRVKVVDRLDEPDAPHLKEIVHVLPAPGEFLDHGEDEPQVPADELFPRVLIPGPGLCQKRLRFLAAEPRQARGIDAADLYLSLHEAPIPLCFSDGFSMSVFGGIILFQKSVGARTI